MALSILTISPPRLFLYLRPQVEERWLAITRLSSFKSACVMVSVGQPIAKTIDACSASGNVNLQHESLEVLRRDYAAFHELVEAGLFEVH